MSATRAELVSRIKRRARESWGDGFDRLGPELRHAVVCAAMVGAIVRADDEDAERDKPSEAWKAKRNRQFVELIREVALNSEKF